MAAIDASEALKPRPAPGWDIGERPTTAQAYITLPPYVCGDDEVVRHRSADGNYMTQAGVVRSRHATIQSRRDYQRRESNGFRSSLHKSALDYRTVRQANCSIAR
eukprot:scaffold7974_cov112-Isochrysis_galbana.AAC.1